MVERSQKIHDNNVDCGDNEEKLTDHGEADKPWYSSPLSAFGVQINIVTEDRPVDINCMGAFYVL